MSINVFWDAVIALSEYDEKLNGIDPLSTLDVGGKMQKNWKTKVKKLAGFYCS